MGNFYENLLYIFENIGWFTSGTDASENSRSLSNESVKAPGYTYNLVKVHLTNLYIGIGSYKNSIILYYFKGCIFGSFLTPFL